jgi:hypothetical protein
LVLQLTGVVQNVSKMRLLLYTVMLVWDGDAHRDRRGTKDMQLFLSNVKAMSSASRRNRIV